MGITSPREKIEKKMLELKYKRVVIQEEKLERLEQLKKLLGREVIRKPVPDYIIDDSEVSTRITRKEKGNNTIRKKIKRRQIKKENENKKIKIENLYEKNYKKYK